MSTPTLLGSSLLHQLNLHPRIRNIVYIVDLYHATLVKSKSIEATKVATQFMLKDFSTTSRFDDHLYKGDAELWRLLPRGLMILTQDNTECTTLCGLRKFGDFGDTTLEFPLEKDEIDVSEFYTSKENGECFHVKVYQAYLVCGSKNVHGILRLSHALEDIELYVDDRFAFFRKMARMFVQKYLNDDFVEYSRSHGQYTFCAESVFMDNQHIVSYDQDCMMFFAITSTQYESTLCMNPLEARTVFEALHLPTVDFVELHPIEKREEQWNRVSALMNSEGAVVYVLTNLNRIRKIYKLKSMDYVPKRALREKIKANATDEQIEQRLRSLHVTVPNLEEVIAKAKQFNAFCRIGDRRARIVSQWVTLWKEFEQSYIPPLSPSLASDSTRIAFVAIGIPGTGKTTTLKALMYILGGVYLDQDMFGSNKKRYHDAIHKLVYQPPSCIALGKCNTTHEIREQTQSVLGTTFTTKYIEWYHPDGTDAMVNLCCDRIAFRGAGHQSLRRGGGKDIRSILGSFVDTYEPPSQSDAVIRLDMTKSVYENLMQILSSVDQVVDDAIADEAIVHILEDEDTICIKNVLYWCIEVNREQLLELLKTSDVFIPTHMTLNSNFHVTLEYVAKANLEAKRQAHRFWYNQDPDQELHVVGYRYDGNAVALIVEMDAFPNLEHLHITVALASGVKPVYSKTLLSLTTSPTIRFEEPWVVRGTICTF